MKLYTEIPEHCYPIDYTIDRKEFNNSIEILLKRLSFDSESVSDSVFGINLNHVPGLTGTDRYTKYVSKRSTLLTDNITERDFTEYLTELNDLYVGQVIADIKKQHGNNFQGRTNLIWRRPESVLDMHLDKHVESRYHIPIVTHEDCYWKFMYNDELCRIHMPADNKVWFVDVGSLKHGIFNESAVTRCHLIMSSVYE